MLYVSHVLHEFGYVKFTTWQHAQYKYCSR